MGELKIYLGKVRKDWQGISSNRCSVAGEVIYLTKHSWDCDWYWGFGYIGNKDFHTHFDNTFLEGNHDTASQIFEDPKFTNHEWWIIRDMMIQAYALKAAAEVYRHGGYQTTKKGVTDIIKDDEMCTRLNKDLKAILDTLWNYMDNAIVNQNLLKQKVSILEKEIDEEQDKVDKLREDRKIKMNDLSGKKAQLAELKTHLKEG